MLPMPPRPRQKDLPARPAFMGAGVVGGILSFLGVPGCRYL